MDTVNGARRGAGLVAPGLPLDPSRRAASADSRGCRPHGGLPRRDGAEPVGIGAAFPLAGEAGPGQEWLAAGVVPKKRRPAKAKGITAKTRAADDALRDELRRFDLKKFDKALERALRPSAR